jgi:N-acetyl-alpha-D-muramate 1-phosphate uridylyltransferase
VTALSHAMVLAAGLGLRMRPLTENTAKPLLPLDGRSLLDHALDRLQAAGVREAVVNAHWHVDKVAAAVSGRLAPRVHLQREDELLETGGGVARALPRLGTDPFAVVNGDSMWLDGPVPALARLAAALDPATMDGVLLLVRSAQVEGEVGSGDFLLDPLGRLRRPKEREVAPYIFAGVQVLSHALFADAPRSGAFSLNRLYDRAIAAGRLHALVHDGVWFHLSTPPDLERAEAAMQAGLAKAPF